jgi:hypothetical protein
VFELARTLFHLIGQPKKKAARALHRVAPFAITAKAGRSTARQGRVGWVFFFFSNRFGYFGSLMLSGAIRLALLFRLGVFGRTAARTEPQAASPTLPESRSCRPGETGPD